MRNESQQQIEAIQEREKRRAGHPVHTLFLGNEKEQKEHYRPLLLDFCKRYFTMVMKKKPYQIKVKHFGNARFLALIYSAFSYERIIVGIATVETWINYLDTFLPEKMSASPSKTRDVVTIWNTYRYFILNGPKYTETYEKDASHYREHFHLMHETLMADKIF